MKVVVVDDDPIALEIAVGTLQSLGHEATTLPSAIGASAFILRERPDVVLIDLKMPALPGDDWLDLVTHDRLAAEDGYEPTFVVFSASPVEEIERVVSETCAVAYIRKSGGPEAFEATFDKLARDLI